jgi:hypothetical protein
MYLPSTRILNNDAFVDILKVRMEMKRNKVSDFQLVLLENNGQDIKLVYPKISEGIRTADVVGMLNDGKCYILLSQSDKEDSLEVLERLKRLGVNGRLVDTNEVLFV